MPGQGKYTKYAIPADSGDYSGAGKNNLLSKIFGKNANPGDGPGTLPPQMVYGPGKEVDVRAAIVAMGRELLQSTTQQGDVDHFPSGVDMSYGQAPDLTQVKWVNPGDPANPYVADITSPGVGNTEGVDKSTDPEISTEDLKPNYVPGGPETGTQSPATTSQGLTDTTKLGNTLVKGSSKV